MTVDKEKMDEIFSNLGEDATVAILVHPSPDPDCMGAAVGFSVLMKEVYGVNCKTYHFGEVSHPQNKSMKNILHISLENGQDFNPDNFAAFVVLDTDLEGTGFKSEKLKKVDVRLDHHESDRGNGAKIKDVRVVGSTCAIVWDYLNEFGIKLEEYVDETAAMVLGIITDTLDLTRPDTSDLDHAAYLAMLPLVNKSAMAKVINFPLPKSWFETEAKAYKDKETRGTTLISYTGEVTELNRDVIAYIADRFSRMDGVGTCVIMGIIDYDLVVCVRSDDTRVDVHALCVGAFGKGNAGGKDGSGGARFNLGPAFQMISDKETREKVKMEIVDQLKENIFESLGEHKDNGE